MTIAVVLLRRPGTILEKCGMCVIAYRGFSGFDDYILFCRDLVNEICTWATKRLVRVRAAWLRTGVAHKNDECRMIKVSNGCDMDGRSVKTSVNSSLGLPTVHNCSWFASLD